jgi:hypothetical protein
MIAPSFRCASGARFLVLDSLRRPRRSPAAFGQPGCWNGKWIHDPRVTSDGNNDNTDSSGPVCRLTACWPKCEGVSAHARPAWWWKWWTSVSPGVSLLGRRSTARFRVRLLHRQPESAERFRQLASGKPKTLAASRCEKKRSRHAAKLPCFR